MSVVLSIEAKEYLKKKNASQILLDVEIIREPCLQVYNPKVRVLKREIFDRSSLSNEFIIDNCSILISDEFIKIFGSTDSLHLNIEGLLKKKLGIENIDPIIKNTCRID